jgi:hypothetical protein
MFTQKCIYVSTGFTHNSQKQERTQMSFNRGIVKPNVVPPYCEILPRAKKKKMTIMAMIFQRTMPVRKANSKRLHAAS